MSNTLSKLSNLVQSLRFRDVLILFILVLIALPVWLTWRIVESPDKLGALIELKTGQRVTGSVLSCKLITSQYSSRPSFQVVKETDLGKGSYILGLYAESGSAFSIEDARAKCRILEAGETSMIKSKVEATK